MKRLLRRVIPDSRDLPAGGVRKSGHRAIVLAVLLLCRAGAAAADDERAILTAIVNDVDKGEVIVVVRNGDVLVDSGALKELGLHNLSGQPVSTGGGTFVSLASLAPAVTYEVDERALALRLTVSPSNLGSETRNLASARPAGVEYRSDTSAFVNYSLEAGGPAHYGAFADLGASTHGVLLNTTMSWNRSEAAIRGLSSATIDQRDALRRIVVGDSFAYGGLLGGSALHGGVSVSREYSIDPYFVRYPSFNMSGAVATPSTVDVYLNDRLVSTERVAPGQFDMMQLPVINGRNDARLVVRDAFGGVREMSGTYYLTTDVLARGLQEYQYSFGAERERFGVESWTYGPLGFVGRHRIGITDRLTLGGRFEARGDLASGGPSFSARLPIGGIEAAVAWSRASGTSGGAAAAAYSYVGRPFSVSLSVSGTTSRYATSSLRPDADRPLHDVSALVSTQMGPRATVSLQWRDAEMRTGLTVGRTSVVATSRLNGRADLFASASWGRGTANPGTEAFAGLMIRLTARAVASVAVEHAGGDTRLVADAQQPLPVGTGFGYRVRSEANTGQFSSGAMMYQNAFGRYEITREVADGVQQTTVRAAGSVVAIGGGVYPSRPVQDGFALVQVPNVQGVRTYASNQEVGRTDARGKLLVPNLLSYYGNILDISDQDVPLDYGIAGARRTVAPPYRGGAVVVFPVERVQSTTGLLRLRIDDRVVIPSYGELRVAAGDRQIASPVGGGGEFYLENVGAGIHDATLIYGVATCAFRLTVPQSDASVIDLGTIACVVPR